MKLHQPVTTAPSDPATSQDYLQLGDYEYERGNCQRAINNYSRALRINPLYPEAYNNRAYVSMRLRNYKEAIDDLDMAIELRPDYPHALMNRGDIRNYYYLINRDIAINDYDRVVAMGKEVVKKEAVCGHRLMASRNGNWLLVM
jgi:tetratricopeptide (TPR) repeat protein